MYDDPVYCSTMAVPGGGGGGGSRNKRRSAFTLACRGSCTHTHDHTFFNRAIAQFTIVKHATRCSVVYYYKSCVIHLKIIIVHAQLQSYMYNRELVQMLKALT